MAAHEDQTGLFLAELDFCQFYVLLGAAAVAFRGA